jgi:hypothetical protein
VIKRWRIGLVVLLAIIGLGWAHVVDPKSGLLPEDAVRAIGTNGIPKMLAMIAAKDPPEIIVRAADRLGFRRLSADYLNQFGLNGFQFLKTNGASGAPGLVAIIERNRSPRSVICATEALEEIGPAAQIAVAAITRNFDHEDNNVRMVSSAALIRIGGKPEIAVPALIKACSNTNGVVRWNAVSTLQVYGTNAEAAVPELLKMLKDPSRVGDSKMRANIEQTLRLAGFRETNSISNQTSN